ncbi:MAG TPA: RDD family protein [Candidatus Nanoarchaeia archaeon]|nr:RDD family protein [Candidatus Nanoarchaeia archaeon]
MKDPDYYIYDLPDENLLDEKASVWKRALAYIIDLLLFNMTLYPIFIQSFESVSGLRIDSLTIDYLMFNSTVVSQLFGVISASTVIFCFYLSLSEYYFGMTIGKMFTGLRIEGKTSLWGYVTRNLFKSTLVFLLPIDLIGLITGNQRLIDKSLGINVLQTNKIKLVEDFIK